jgi:hypothetical protein
MLSKMHSTLCVVAAVLCLDVASAPFALAQDVMELDLAFKNGQLPTSQGQRGTADLQGRRQHAREAQKLLKPARRHPKRYRHAKI